MADGLVLRISDVPVGEYRRVEVTWQDGSARRAAVSAFAYQADAEDAEKVRWYLEDYAEFPADPAPRLARDAEAILAATGTGLFGHVFNGLDAAGIWDRARARLGRVRVEVDTDPADVPGLPWELLRDPGTNTAFALGAGEFVRTHLQAAGGAALPAASGDRLRVLLVICRPGGRDDVPFRSVASQLVRGGAEQMDGLDLDVLRPATYPRLVQVLQEAAGAGRPYHVVHFDGHGTYLDIAQLDDTTEGDAPNESASAGDMANGAGEVVRVSPLRYTIPVAGPVRTGQHGYLIFENPGNPSNQQLVDGPALGRLLASADVPVLVLNACRSAYAEAPPRPRKPGDSRDVPGSDAQPGDRQDGNGLQLADMHARIRAYGSLAAEVADAGVPGVVAMRYNVYVATAAQYAADLYAHLLAGKTLGQATTAARRALAASPARHITTTTSVDLQDWAVPVVYEAAPLALLQPSREAPLIRLSTSDGDSRPATADLGSVVPGPPDAGFFGRDETLLALDRAFDAQQMVLLLAYAGAGKSSTAAEFARWYRSTGGLDHPGHPERGAGPLLWSTFDHHLPLDRLLDIAGDCFSAMLEAGRIPWQAITSPAQRRNLILQVLTQVPVLWVWDNVESVSGFPPGTQSAWTQAERDELLDFLRDLTTKTRCKVLLTSRNDEQRWLTDLPTRLHLPPMPMRERLQLAAAIATRHHQADPGIDWRPLLRYTSGNPLTITVLVGQALRDHLTTNAQLEAFVERLRAGEQDLEPGEDAALGRARSLAASLSYGFTHAFTGAERAQLAVLHLFRDTVNADALRMMGDAGIVGDDAVPQLAGLTREDSIGLLDRAADIGLLTQLAEGYYSIHPALPWYFTTLYATTFGPLVGPGAQQVTRAYIHTFAWLADYYHRQNAAGASDPVPVLRAEESNLLHALDSARAGQRWGDVAGCLQGLSVLYRRTGRNGEWARLVRQITPDFIDPDSGGSVPGREDQWDLISGYRVRLAMEARDWPTATQLQNTLITRSRDRAATALATSNDQLTQPQRNLIRNLAVTEEYLGYIFRQQGHPDCLPHLKEALNLYQRIGARTEEANLANTIGISYVKVPGLRDLDQAERWFQHSLDLRLSEDKEGRAIAIAALASISFERFQDARAAGEAAPVLLEHINAALRGYQQALTMASPDDHESLAVRNSWLGAIYYEANDTRQALHHFQQSIKHNLIRGDSYNAGTARYDIAIILAEDGRRDDALMYARAALHDFEKVGGGAAHKAAEARDLITQLEHET